MLFRGKNDLRCPVCLLEFNQAAMMAAGVKGCPGCTTALQPMKVSEDGYIKINWQELRTLAIYAQRWSITFDLKNGGNRDSLKALQNILAGLRKYEPIGGQPLVPPFDAVVIERNAEGGISIPGPEPQDGEPVKLQIVRNPDTSLKPDHTGFIPSPFYKRRKL
jgi:hypothetical protein